jgi:hypothetical protein
MVRRASDEADNGCHAGAKCERAAAVSKMRFCDAIRPTILPLLATRRVKNHLFRAMMNWIGLAAEKLLLV